ncbi:MAG: hypothetical protein CMD14_06230, partial [Flavobacteriales bacterium]|nr:hypothetical protein [Flavobacteriales bacterium]
MKKLQKNIVLLLVIFLGCLNHNLNAQCVVPDAQVPICIVVGDTVTFSNQSIDNNCAPCAPYGPQFTCGGATTFDWFVYDDNGAFIWYSNNYDLEFAFTSSGTYTISLDADIPGANWKCCPNSGNGIDPPWQQQIVVVDSILSITSNDSIAICDGGGIDTSDLNLQIYNAIGAVDFLWTSFPSGQQFNTVNPSGINPNDNLLQLTITDLVTQCQASTMITMSITATNTDASFNAYYLNPGSGCASDPIVFVANDSTNTNVSWIINNNLVIGNTSSITTSLSQYLSGSSSVNVSLTLLDSIAGCSVSSDSDFVFSAPPFIALDTSLTNPNLPTFYSTTYHGFSGCNTTNGVATLSFQNSNYTFGNQNIDSLVFSWPDSTSSILTDSSLAAFLSNGSITNSFLMGSTNSVFTVTAFDVNGCSYSTDYTVLTGGTGVLNTISSIGFSVISSTLCSDTNTWFYITNPYSIPPNEPILEIGPNDIVTWRIYCEYDIPQTFMIEEEWDANDYASFLTELPNGDSAVVFRYTFPENSCDCTGPITPWEAYTVSVDLDRFCNTQLLYSTQAVQIEDPPEAEFSTNSPQCRDNTIMFDNTTEAGCDGITLNQQLDSVLVFQWDFGDCDSAITSGYLYPFPGTQHQYMLPGEYTVNLTLKSNCGTTYDSEVIVINPLPNVSFDADPVCLGKTTFFNNKSYTDSAYTRLASCYSPPRIINVPAGGNIVYWEWMIDTNLTGAQQYAAWNALGEFKSINGGPITNINDEELAFQFDSCGTYTVWLRALDSNGCDSIYSFNVIVYDLPEPTFSTEEVCQGNCTPIIDSSYAQTNPCIGNPLVLWEYEIYNAINDTLMDSIIYDNSTYEDTSCYEFFPPCDLFSSTMSYDYHIWLTVTDSFGCRDSIMDTVTVLCQPIAEFDSSDICLGDVKFFENKSSPVLGMDWQWEIDTTLGDYVNGTTDTSESPYFLFDTCGTFSVKQILKSDNCNDTIIHSITVFCLPEPSFFANPECEGDTIQVISTSQPGDDPSAFIDTWIWDFAPSENDDTVLFVFSSCDSIDVTLSVVDTNGCQQDTTQKIFVFCNPTALFNVNNQCFDDEQQPIEFDDASTYITTPINYWEWTINGTGDYVFPYDSLDPFTQYQFDVCGPQFFSLYVRDSNGCEDIKPGTMIVYCEPTADFNADPVCLNETTVFEDLSTPVGTITSWEWDFGDSTPFSTDTNPTHDYASCDSFIVRLAIEDINGCNDTIDKTVVVWCLPQPSFYADPECEDSTVTFISTSQPGNPPSAPITQWNWSFSSVNNDTVTNVYSLCNDYNETLTVTDTNSCSETVSDTITIYCPPIADFDVNNECNDDQPIEFNDNSSDGDAPINYWEWTINEPGGYVFPPYNAFLDSTKYQFTDCGIKSFSLYVRDTNDCAANKAGTMQVYCEPTADFNAAPVCLNETTIFQDASLPSGTITNWYWDFGDGDTSMQQDPTHQYLSCDSFIVRLVIEDSNGCNDTIFKTVVVHCLPDIISLSADNSGICEEDTITFSTTYVQGDGLLDDWILYFGDGNSTLQLRDTNFIAYVYDTCGGLFTATYIISDVNNCSDTDLVSFNVYCPPSINQASAIVENVCLGGASAFTAAIDTGTSSIITNILNWGDSTPTITYPFDTLSMLHHTYEDSGTYVITLIVTDTSGCTDTSEFDVRIHPNPTAELSFTNVCKGFPTDFQINTIPGDGDITIWEFNYISGLSSASTGNLAPNYPDSLQYTYSQCDSIAVSLWVRDFLNPPFGLSTLTPGTDDNNNFCESIIDTVIVVYCPPIANINFVDPYVCEDDTSFFTNFSQQGPTPSAPIDTTLWNWIFGASGIGDSTLFNGAWIYDTCGVYDIEFIATDTNNCSDTSNLVSTVVLCNTDASFIVDNNNFCGPDTVMATADSSYASYDWDTPPLQYPYVWQTSTNDWQYFTFFVENPGPDSVIYSIILETKQVLGLCPDSDTVDIVIYPKPLVSFIPDSSSGCGPWEITFNNTSDPNNGNENISSMNFQWLINDSIVSDSSVLVYEFDNIAEDDTCYIVSLIGFTMHGCVDTFETQICINPDPTAQIDTLNNNVTTNCAPFIIDNSVIDFVEYPNANDTYSWYITDGDNNIIVPAQPSVPNYT